MNIRNKLSENHILLFIKLIPYMFYEYWNFSKYVARCGMSKNSEKLLTEILMTTHALEKAFSLYNKHKGFGVRKIVSLVVNIKKYISKYGYSEKLNVSIALINSYLNYQENVGYENDILDGVKQDFQEIVKNNYLDCKIFEEAGFVVRSKMEMLEATKIDFKKLAYNRFSFRHFSEKDVSNDIITEALDIAKKSPSACNRQAYRVHVFSGKEKDFILQMQGGANSFYNEANKAVLITGNMNRYFTTEMHLPYVDGSLFAMSFIYALTSLGIASIPLTMGRKLEIIKNMKYKMHIPENEVPVILIAIGHYPDNATLSLSYRNQVEKFTTFH